MVQVRLRDLEEHVAHFRRRVMADALQEATAAYWRRRAETFQAAMPRATDFTGQASAEDIEARRMRLAAVTLACRQRAVFMLGGEVE